MPIHTYSNCYSIDFPFRPVSLCLSISFRFFPFLIQNIYMYPSGRHPGKISPYIYCASFSGNTAIYIYKICILLFHQNISCHTYTSPSSEGISSPIFTTKIPYTLAWPPYSPQGWAHLLSVSLCLISVYVMVIAFVTQPVTGISVYLSVRDSPFSYHLVTSSPVHVSRGVVSLETGNHPEGILKGAMGEHNDFLY